MRIAAVVFAKPPRAGAAKTRLAATLGPDAAAALAGAFLRDTFAALAREPWLDPILCTPEPAEDHGVEAVVWDQGGGDLGARLERAFRRGLLEHPAVLALGADSPGLPSGHLRAVRSALASHAAALGPAEDGGFWGLALTSCPPGLLAGLPWSSPDTARATLERLAPMSPAVVDPWWDVDVEADLRRVRAEVPREVAPATHAALDDLWR